MYKKNIEKDGQYDILLRPIFILKNIVFFKGTVPQKGTRVQGHFMNTYRA